MTNEEKGKYDSIEELIRARGKLLNRQVFRSFILMLAFILVFVQWFLKEDPAWFLATLVAGPIALSVFFAAMKRSEEFSAMQQELVKTVLTERIRLCLLIANNTPANVSHLRFFPLEERPVKLYTPLQWWTDGHASLVAGEAMAQIKTFKETIEPWISGKFEDSELVSLDQVYKYLFTLEADGIIEEIKGLPRS